jgi:antitoxin (DNA-binding transcriptional repressor) of toxin-antitoxin stability system
MPSGIERVREIRRLRSRRKKTAKLIARVKAGSIDKTEAIRKLRKLTPGADVIITREGWV